MPPLMTQRQPINIRISQDESEVNHDEHGANFVFTDISLSKSFRVSVVVLDFLLLLLCFVSFFCKFFSLLFLVIYLKINIFYSRRKSTKPYAAK